MSDQLVKYTDENYHSSKGDDRKYVRIFIITYKRNDKLHNLLGSILNDEVKRLINCGIIDVHIIDNGGECSISDIYNNYATVIRNTLRPTWSTGHLARSWNQCILHSFEKDLRGTKWMLCLQEDTLMKANWLDIFNTYIDKPGMFDFVQFGEGDECFIMNKQNLHKIGLWDERFNSISYQEFDYYTRTLLYNSERTSLNWIFILHKEMRIHAIIENVPCGIVEHNVHHISTYHGYNQQLYLYKWGKKHTDIFRIPENPSEPPLYKEHIKGRGQPMLYPYFERDLAVSSTVQYLVF